ncbi:glycosyltransferase, partial [Pelagibacteraceae bacterium]|nr:glycosyltransferase [Pelagibacteraceae bacterium]
MKLSVIIISYKSETLLKKLLLEIPSRHQITIIENSLLKITKKNIEKKFKNTKVIIPSENLGYASAVNLAFDKCKNNFILMITPDVKIDNKAIIKLENFIKKFQKFTLLSPVYKKQNIHRNYSLLNSN